MKYYININNIFIFKNIFISTPDSPILNTASHNNWQSCATPSSVVIYGQFGVTYTPTHGRNGGYYLKY